jgi:hypothetical protein
MGVTVMAMLTRNYQRQRTNRLWKVISKFGLVQHVYFSSADNLGRRESSLENTLKASQLPPRSWNAAHGC